MLDLKYVLANVEAVKQNCRNRNVPADVLDDLDRVVALGGERKALLQEVEDGPPPPERGGPGDRQGERPRTSGRELVAEGKRLKAEVGRARGAAQGSSTPS